MAKKIMAIFIVALVAIIVIYKLFYHSNYKYLALGDGTASGNYFDIERNSSYVDNLVACIKKKQDIMYNKEFIKADDRIIDLINKIKDNKTIKINNQTTNIMNKIKNADLITLSIGQNELLYKLRDDSQLANIKYYLDGYINDLEQLILILRQHNKKQLIVLLPYNYLVNNDSLNEIFNYLNNSYVKLSSKYEFAYLNLNNIVGTNSKYINQHYLTKRGHQRIGQILCQQIK